MRTGDIVLISFPFSELTNAKVRPALVITVTRDKYPDLVLCAISSQVPSQISSNEFLLTPSALNRLRVTSVLKIDRIFTLKAEKVVATLGTLSATELVRFRIIFKSLVD